MSKLTTRWPVNLIFRTDQDTKDKIKALGYLYEMGGDMSKAMRFILKKTLEPTIANLSDEERAEFYQILENITTERTLAVVEELPELTEIPEQPENEGDTNERRHEGPEEIPE